MLPGHNSPKLPSIYTPAVEMDLHSMQTPAKPQPSLWKTYLLFLAPMVLSNFLQSMSGTVNSIYIGQMLGTQALAAVSGMFPIVFFFIALVIGRALAPGC